MQLYVFFPYLTPSHYVLTVFLCENGGMDRGSVYRFALSRIGEQEFKEGTPTARACERWYLFVLRRAAARYNWTFSKVTETLKKEESVEDGFNRFPYPLGCLKITRFLTAAGREVSEPRLFADGIYVPADECPEVLRVEYQSDLTALKGELPDRCPEFCDGVICLLASRLAMELTSHAQLAEALAVEAERHFAGAIATDRQQDWSNARRNTLSGNNKKGGF